MEGKWIILKFYLTEIMEHLNQNKRQIASKGIKIQLRVEFSIRIAAKREVLFKKVKQKDKETENK